MSGPVNEGAGGARRSPVDAAARSLRQVTELRLRKDSSHAPNAGSSASYGQRLRATAMQTAARVDTRRARERRARLKAAWRGN